MTEYPTLTDNEALDVTTKIVISISDVKPASKMMEAFSHWEGMVVAMTMIIDSNRSIADIDSEIENLISGKDERGINSLLDLRKNQMAVNSEATYNYSKYHQFLLDVGVEI